MNGIVGVDIGYSHVKAVSKGFGNRKHVLFRSVQGIATEFDFGEEDILQAHPGMRIEHDGQTWFVGSLAEAHVPAEGQITLVGRAEEGNDFFHLFRYRLLLSAMAQLFSGYMTKDSEIPFDIFLVTGLPSGFMADAPLLKKGLVGAHRVISNNADFLFSVNDVAVMPQPMGTIYRRLFDRDGNLSDEMADQKTITVVDVGGYTIDVSTLAFGEYVSSRSGTVASGTHVAMEAARKEIRQMIAGEPTISMIDRALTTGTINVNGESRAVSTIEKAMRNVATSALGLLQAKIGSGADIDEIVIAGGGAEVVAKEIQRKYPRAVIAENPQSSNCEGYLRYGMYRASAGQG